MRTSSKPRATGVARIDLVKGVFDASEAHHLLMNLVNYKIGFHELKRFRELECLGRHDEHSAERIRELTEERRRLMPLLREAAQRGEAFRIDATLEIRRVGDAKTTAAPPRRRARSGRATGSVAARARG